MATPDQVAEARAENDAIRQRIAEARIEKDKNRTQVEVDYAYDQQLQTRKALEAELAAVTGSAPPATSPAAGFFPMTAGDESPAPSEED
jgi:septal ring factor EnvC (AmiA/AmiB activator)